MGFTKDGFFKLPGFTSTFNMKGQVEGEGYFVWAEALHYEGGSNGYYRSPESKEVVENILKQARQLNEFRRYIGKPIIVTSWYRDPVTNRLVGGARNSFHLRGLATDIVVPGMSGFQVGWKAQEFGWQGGIGFYAGFTHLDSRGYRSIWYG